MKTALLLFCFLLVVSCYYEPEGEFKANPIPVTLDGVFIDLQDISDTLFVDDYVQINYSVTNLPPDVPTVGVKAYLGEVEIYAGLNSGTIVIDPYHQGTGIFKCKVEYISRSGSGSLAEQAGKEFVFTYRQFVVVVDIDGPENTVITSIDNNNGKVNIHWNKCTKRNFGSYRVVKECSKDGWNYQPCGNVEITDPNVTSWTDEDFVAGSATYRIITTANSRSSFGTARRYDFFPKTDFTIVDKKTIVNWDKPMHFANTKSVTLKDFSINPFESLQVTDTLFETSFLPDFGYISEIIEITYHSQTPENSYSFRVPCYLGTRHDSPALTKPVYYSQASDQYYGFSSDGLNALDHDFNLLTDEYNLNPLHIITISQNGEFLVAHDIAAPDRPLHQLNLESVKPDATLSLTNIFGLQDLATINYNYERFGYNFSVGDNGCVAISTNGGSRIFRLPLFDELFTGPRTDGPFVISSSGNYAYLNGKFLKFNGSTFQEILDMALNPINVLSDRDDNFILTFADNLKIINPDNGLIVREVDVPLDNSYYVRYDPFSNLLLLGNGQNYCLVNLANGDKQTFKASYNLNIVRGKLFSSDSFQFYSIDAQFYFQP